MTPDDPLDARIDALIRDHLDREAATVDARAVLARVKAARPAPVRANRGWKRTAFAAVAGLAVAASVAVVFTLGGGPEPRVATAAELVREAREVHTAPADRAYDVIAEWNPVPLKRLGIDPLTQKSRLWTRGDLFAVSGTGPTGNAYSWGQGADGRVWVALGTRRGLIYDPAEVGEPLTKYIDLMSLRAAATLGELLEGYELFRRDSGRPGEPIRIEATLPPRPFHPDPRFRKVELELDPDTKAIRRAVLSRQANGETVGTLTFTLAETGDKPADFYELRGHVEPNAIVLEGSGLPPAGTRPPPTRRTVGPPAPGLPPIPGDPRARFREEFLKRMRARAAD